jgi:hypothetical protein
VKSLEDSTIFVTNWQPQILLLQTHWNRLQVFPGRLQKELALESKEIVELLDRPELLQGK